VAPVVTVEVGDPEPPDQLVVTAPIPSASDQPVARHSHTVQLIEPVHGRKGVFRCSAPGPTPVGRGPRRRSSMLPFVLRPPDGYQPSSDRGNVEDLRPPTGVARRGEDKAAAESRGPHRTPRRLRLRWHADLDPLGTVSRVVGHRGACARAVGRHGGEAVVVRHHSAPDSNKGVVLAERLVSAEDLLP
jgi:hypothetical protein